MVFLVGLCGLKLFTNKIGQCIRILLLFITKPFTSTPTDRDGQVRMDRQNIRLQ